MWHSDPQILEHQAQKHFENAARCEIFDDVANLTDITEALTNAFMRGVKVAFVDYVQLVTVSPGMNKFEEVSQVSGALKQLAKQHNVIIVALAQLNKRVLYQRPTDATLGDIDYGTKLAHDADQVIYLMHPHRLNSQKNHPDDYLVILEKNRHGEAKKLIQCKFNPLRQRISEQDLEPALPETELKCDDFCED